MMDTPPGAILLAWRGSLAHGMQSPAVAPVEHYFGLQPWGSRGTLELRQAVALLLAGNPNLLSLLWLRPEHYLFRTAAADRLLAAFRGKHAYDSFRGLRPIRHLRMCREFLVSIFTDWFRAA
jgi:predicted nucleotidyltransferase